MKRIIGILVIEDDLTALAEIKRTLDKRSILCRLTVARTADEALSTLKDEENQPDIILLNLGMHATNGMEFVQVVRDNPQWKNIKIFIMTTFDTPVDRKRANKLGISGFIPKPLKLESPSSIDSYNLMMDLMNL